MIKREFAFRVRSGSSEEFLIRNESFGSHSALKQRILNLCPIKIDIGAFFNLSVKLKKNQLTNSDIIAEEREFVIDIDISDYNHIRSCCTGTGICQSCFKFLKAGHKALEHILNKCFGFNTILWTFSGRRGIHAWIYDKEARKMGDKLRQAVTKYISITNSSTFSDHYIKQEFLDKPDMSCLLDSLFNELKEFHIFLLNEQRILDNPEIDKKVIIMAERCMNKRLSEVDKLRYQQTTPPIAKFTRLAKLIKQYTGDKQLAERFTKEFVISFLYPILDVSVSSSTQHLLRSPFSVHYDTLKICLPIIDFNSFNVMKSLTLNDLVASYNRDNKNLLQDSLFYVQSFINLIK